MREKNESLEKIWKANETILSFSYSYSRFDDVYIEEIYELIKERKDKKLLKLFTQLEQELVSTIEAAKQQIESENKQDEVVHLNFVISANKKKEKHVILSVLLKDSSNYIFVSKLDKEPPKTIEIEKFILPQDVVTKKVFFSNEFKDKKTVEIVTSKEHKATVTVSLELLDIQKFQELFPNFTSFDMGVFAVACTFFKQGQDTFTNYDIHKVLFPRTKPTTKRLDEIHQSIEKLASVRIKIDSSNEKVAFVGINLDGNKVINGKLVRYGQMLPIETIAIETEDKKTPIAVYKFNSSPVLFEYAERKRQITTIPSKWLETKKVSQTTKIKALQIELLTKTLSLIHMYEKNRVSQITLRDVLKRYANTKQERSRLRKQIKILFEELKEKMETPYTFELEEDYIVIAKKELGKFVDQVGKFVDQVGKFVDLSSSKNRTKKVMNK